MKLKEHSVNQCTKRIVINLDGEDIVRGYQTYFKRIQGSASIPGFRKGKAPIHLVEAHYKKQAKEEVRHSLIWESLQEAISQLKLDLFGDPTISDIEFDDSKLSYQALVEIRPEVQVKKYKGLSVKQQPIEVKPEEIDSRVEHLRNLHATEKAVEDRPAKAGDFVIVELGGEVEGKTLFKKQERTLELSEEKLFPEYFQNLVGMALNETKNFTVLPPKGAFAEPNLEGKEQKITATLKEIKELVLPELGSELLKTLGDFESVEALRSSIEKDIRRAKDEEEKSRLERELLDQICKATRFDVPEGFVKRQKHSMIESQKKRLLSMGYPESEIEKNMGDIEKSCDEEAERQVRVAFILDQIAKAENIEVTEEDLSERFYALSRRYHRPVDAIRKHYEENNLIGSLRAELRNDKTVALIRENAVIK